MADDNRMTGRRPGTGGRPGHPTTHARGRTSYGFRGESSRGARAGFGPQIRDRPLSDLLAPAAVILAGVLVVVAVAVAVTISLRSDDRASTALPTQPPPLGGGPPAGDPIPIPAPSTPSPSASAEPSPIVTEPDTGDKPPTSPPGAPRDTGDLTISRAGVPTEVDLSAEGTRDWVHWGEQDTFSLERDKSGKFAILEGRPDAPRFRHALSPQRFSWVGGAPVDHSTGTPTGVRTCGKDNGFTITAPAGRGNRTLRLYVGVTLARGRLEARLSAGGRTVSAKLEERGASMQTGVFTLAYQAPSNGGTIRVKWITEASFDSACGGVALQAATLQ